MVLSISYLIPWKTFFKLLFVKLFKASTSALSLVFSLLFFFFFCHFRAFHSCSLGINQGVTAASVTAHRGSLSVLFYAHFEENLSCFESLCQSEAVTPCVPPSLCATNPTKSQRVVVILFADLFSLASTDRRPPGGRSATNTWWHCGVIGLEGGRGSLIVWHLLLFISAPQVTVKGRNVAM